MSKKEKYGIGKKFITNEGYEVEIVEKFKGVKRKVRFDNGHEVITECSVIDKESIKNPYHPSVCGIGCYGVGESKAIIEGKKTQEYAVWHNMIERCYDKKYQKRQPTYKGILVYKEWLNYQNFAKWYNDNYPKIKGIKFQLDKDLLQQNVDNKIYSPDTCVFLPYNINNFLANKQTKQHL